MMMSRSVGMCRQGHRVTSFWYFLGTIRSGVHQMAIPVDRPSPGLGVFLPRSRNPMARGLKTCGWNLVRNTSSLREGSKEREALEDSSLFYQAMVQVHSSESVTCHRYGKRGHLSPFQMPKHGPLVSLSWESHPTSRGWTLNPD